MNFESRLQEKVEEIKQLHKKRDTFLDKKEERSESEEDFLKEHKDRLAKLEKDKEWLKKMLDEEVKIKGILLTHYYLQ